MDVEKPEKSVGLRDESPLHRLLNEFLSYPSRALGVELTSYLGKDARRVVVVGIMTE